VIWSGFAPRQAFTHRIVRSPTNMPRSPTTCFTRDEARRARSPWPLGLPWREHPSPRGGGKSGDPGLRSTDVCYPRFRFQRAGSPISSRCTPRCIPTQPGVLGFTPRSTLRRAVQTTRSVSSPCALCGVPLMLRYRWLRAPTTTDKSALLRCSKHGPPSERRARKRGVQGVGPSVTEVTPGRTRPAQTTPTAPRERLGF